MTRQTLLTTLISLICLQGFGQEIKNDTTFLIRQTKNGNYHAVFIDTARSSPYYDRLTDFSFGPYGQREFDVSLKYLKARGLKLSFKRIEGIPRRWVLLKQYQGRFYTYSPSDYYFHYKVGITDSSFIDYTGEGPYASKIIRFNKMDDKTFSFQLAGLLAPERSLIIHVIDEKNGVAVFEEEEKRGHSKPMYFLMIAAEKIKNFPIIVNYCKTVKQTEFQFMAPDYQKLLSNTSSGKK